ncbi:hypothetical protein CXG81DRAFT_17988 [Caulochytrium protostelioides]|uniref:phosphoinositide 5-phosphatase n=1 Tax=Caulochytrium protostelioides TaxID=1555241 RepID=A0A4P9XAG2_9FUNG|nr:hypothetical protein CXG81DRAFT_17988 [Caulochytrium protostelioides]|eukprot:RKP02322.1 hypothetical protein CXG81DRAFT_17988 [Caulochytrium protostelioides]
MATPTPPRGAAPAAAAASTPGSVAAPREGNDDGFSEGLPNLPSPRVTGHANQAILFKRRHPRALYFRPAINATAQGLIFEATPFPAGSAEAKACTARFQPANTLDIAEYTLLQSKPVYGCLGLVKVKDEIFIGVITEAQRLGRIEGSPVYRVLKTCFYSATSDRFDDLDDELFATESPATSPTTATAGGSHASANAPAGGAHPCAALMKLLALGSFYFSPSLDLTRSLQRRVSDMAGGKVSTVVLAEDCDPHFVWNRFMLAGLLQIREQELTIAERYTVDMSGVLPLLIQGFVGFFDAPHAGVDQTVAIISRLGCKRAGTRFLARGVDDTGNVSNFVETEFLLYTPQRTFSYLQLRGSIPLFWQQTGIQVNHKITITRDLDGSMNAVQKHFAELTARYGFVQIVNLLSQKEASQEALIGACYHQAVTSLPIHDRDVFYYEWDFHHHVGKNSYERLQAVLDDLGAKIASFGYFLMNNPAVDVEKAPKPDVMANAVLQIQSGITRVNCLDCLDRTNVVQARIAKFALMQHLLRQEPGMAGFFNTDAVQSQINNLWADNGDWLSKIYAGTGAIKASLTRRGKQTMMDLLDDAAKSVNRFLINNFQDKARQEAIDLLLGKLAGDDPMVLRNPLHEVVNAEMREHFAEYARTEPLPLFIGTWNVNGKLPQRPSDLADLLRPAGTAPQLYILGVQEMSELSPSQYMAADWPKLRMLWTETFTAAIRHVRTDAAFACLRTDHLAALGFFLFCRADMIGAVNEIEMAQKRTGMGGIAANKGAIGCSFRFHDTRLCFVTAHFAAGQSQVNDRNRDFWTINDGITFKAGRRIADHDYIFWLGDFNYRVDLPNEQVRAYINASEATQLLPYDQLTLQRGDQMAFTDYKEGPLSFLPTYKFDNGTDRYDTSDKQRTPSWTDRILYQGPAAELVEYTSAPTCMMSDHRPVWALVRISTTITDPDAKSAVQRAIYHLYTSGTKPLPPQYQPTKPVPQPRRQRPVSYASPPPLPLRPPELHPAATQAATAAAATAAAGVPVATLIDLSEDPATAASSPRSVAAASSSTTTVVVSESAAASPASSLDPAAKPRSVPRNGGETDEARLPPPATERSQWWHRVVDMGSWIDPRGTLVNPFYPTDQLADDAPAATTTAPTSATT